MDVQLWHMPIQFIQLAVSQCSFCASKTFVCISVTVASLLLKFFRMCMLAFIKNCLVSKILNQSLKILRSSNVCTLKVFTQR